MNVVCMVKSKPIGNYQNSNLATKKKGGVKMEGGWWEILVVTVMALG